LAYSTLGPSHHTTEDIGLLRGIPNLTIFSPSTRAEVKWIMEEAYRIKGPVYIRLGNNTKEFYPEDIQFEVGKPAVVCEGEDVTIITTGPIINEVMQAGEMLNDIGIRARVVSVHTIKPLNQKAMIEVLKDTKKLVVVEEHNSISGLYSAIAECLYEVGKMFPILKIGLIDNFAIGYGTLEEVRAANGLDCKSIFQKIQLWI